jgi:hypothetical protein
MNNPILALPALAATTPSASSIMPNMLAICILGCFTLPLLLPTALVYLLRLQQVSTTDRPSLTPRSAAELIASATLIVLKKLAVGVLSCYALLLMLLTCLVNPHKQGHTSIASHPSLASQETAVIVTSSTNIMTTNPISGYARNPSSLLPLRPLTLPSLKTSLFANPMRLTPTSTPAQPHRSHDVSRPCSSLPHPWRPPLRPLGFPSRLRGANTGIKRLSSTPACHDKQYLFGTSAPLALATAFVELRKPRGDQIDKPAAAITAAANAPVRKAQLQAPPPRAKVRCTAGLATAARWVFGRWALDLRSWASTGSILQACRHHLLAFPRYWSCPLRPLPRHWCLPPRSLNPSSLEATSLAR